MDFIASRVLALTLPVAAVLGAPRSAFADGEQATSVPPPSSPSPAPMGAPWTPPIYQAPLSQDTQTTYVPQSVALSGPKEIADYDPARSAPDGYTPVMRSRSELVQSGVCLFGLSYGISALTAAIGQDTSRGEPNVVAPMWVPVVGPFLQLAQTESATARVVLVGLGAAQVAGAILTYQGLTTKRRVFVRNDLLGPISVAPMIGDGAAGAMAIGHF